MDDFAFLAEHINYQNAEWEKHQRKAIEHSVACGKALIEAKQQVGHGAWLDWMIDNLDFSPRKAQRHMRIARNASKLTHLDSVHAALADLADPKQKRPESQLLDPFGPRYVPHLQRWLPLTKKPSWYVCPHCGKVVH
jgi:hypothetical protein